MFRSQLIGCVLIGLALAFAGNADAGTKSDSKIKANIEASKPGADGKQNVTITINIEKGWYIYANPVKATDPKGKPDDTFDENATRVVFWKGKEKIKGVQVTYPAGKTKEADKFRYHVYEKQVVINAIVQRTAGDTGPLTVAIEVNSCSGGTCLAPGTLRLTVP